MSHIEKDRLRSWIYLAIVFFTSLPISGVFFSFGIFIDIFLKEYGGNNLKTGWAGSILLFSQGISSLVGVYLFRHFGLRRVMFVSAVLAPLSFFSTSYVPSLEYVFLTYSIPFGIACGFYECVSVISLRDYFRIYLGRATGVRYAGMRCGPTIFSYLIPIIFDIAGWNTMMACFSSVGLMFLLLAVSYRPPLDLDNEDGVTLRTRRQEQEDKIAHHLHVTLLLLKDKRILLILSGNALFSVVEYIPNMFVIQYARSLGYPISKSKWLLVSFSLLSIVSRSVFGCVADYVMRLKKMSVLLSVVIVLFGIFSTCFSFTESLVILAVYMGGIGVLDGMYWVMLSFVAMEISDTRYSDIVFTLILFAQAFGYLIGPPAIGFLYDLTGKFSHVLYVVGAVAITAGTVIRLGASLKPTNPEMFNKTTKSLVGTSYELNCTLVVFERETVL